MTTTTQTTEHLLFLQSLTPEQAKSLKDIEVLEQNVRNAKYEFHKSLTKDQVKLRNQANASNNIARLAKKALAENQGTAAS